MRVFTSLTDPDLISCLRSGGLVVLPTDTLYGLVTPAADQAAVERLYQVRGRAPQKPCIVLVGDRADITDTALWTAHHHRLADQYWPGPLSLVTPAVTSGAYLHRGTETLAYRMPAHADLQTLLRQTGMVIAPSANPEGLPPATTLAEAYTYFGDAVDGYVDGGVLAGDQPSTVVAVVGEQPVVLRQGVLQVEG